MVPHLFGTMVWFHGRRAGEGWGLGGPEVVSGEFHCPTVVLVGRQEAELRPVLLAAQFLIGPWPVRFAALGAGNPDEKYLTSHQRQPFKSVYLLSSLYKGDNTELQDELLCWLRGQAWGWAQGNPSLNNQISRCPANALTLHSCFYV